VRDWSSGLGNGGLVVLPKNEAPPKLAGQGGATQEAIGNYVGTTASSRQRPIRRRRRCRRRYHSPGDSRVLQLLAVIRDGLNEDNGEAALFDLQHVDVPPSRIRSLYNFLPL